MKGFQHNHTMPWSPGHAKEYILTHAPTLDIGKRIIIKVARANRAINDKS